MDRWDIFYQSLLLIAFLASVLVFKSSDSSFRVFPLLLVITNVVELTIFFTKANNPSFFFLYHIFIPIEYSLLAYFYFLHLPMKWARRSALISIPTVVLICIFCSYVNGSTQMPTLQFTLAGFCLIALALISIFSIEDFYDVPLLVNPRFLINVGVLIFYSGTMLLMGSYNYLKEIEPESAPVLFRLINTTLNFILYSLFITAFICTSRIRKS